MDGGKKAVVRLMEQCRLTRIVTEQEGSVESSEV